ncbi:MAG: DNA adenine methylase, partial [Candidatus Ranarchaeia archaeon]
FNNSTVSPIEEAALLLYFNKTAYNGLYRVNSNGAFNVPYGRYVNPKIVDEYRIKAASNILKKVKILNKDFSYVLGYAKKGDLCYLDPPYHPISETAKFTSYTRQGFGFQEQRRLLQLCRELDEQGVWFVLSNSSSEDILKLYRKKTNFSIQPIRTNRLISSKPSTRGPVTELLISNIPHANRIRKSQRSQN